MPNTARKRTWIARSAFCYPEVVKVAARPLTGRNARDLHRAILWASCPPIKLNSTALAGRWFPVTYERRWIGPKCGLTPRFSR